MVNGTCVSEELVPKFISGWSEGYAATIVRISYTIDPFSHLGQDWMRQLRAVTGSGMPTARTGNTYYITSEGANEMDAAEQTFDKFPLMLGLMMSAVLVRIAPGCPNSDCARIQSTQFPLLSPPPRTGTCVRVRVHMPYGRGHKY